MSATIPALLAPIRAELAAWDEPICGPSDKSMGWPSKTGGCAFCDHRVTEDADWMERFSRPMIVCVECGCKRCPKAAWHLNECTGSNEPNQETYYPPEMFTRHTVARLLAAVESVLAYGVDRENYTDTGSAEADKAIRSYAYHVRRLIESALEEER